MKSFNGYLLQRYGVLQVRRHGFWFVDIPRTSSSSIKVDLSKRFGVAYGKPNLIEKEHSTRRIFKGHIPANEMRRIVGEKTWKHLFTFTFVRNPWDRMVSMYRYRVKIGKVPANLAFRDYVLELNNSRGQQGSIFSNPIFYMGASEYVLDEQGNCLVDFIGKFETRDEDLRQVARKIGHESLGNSWIQRASPDGRHYSTYYDDETKEVIRRLYIRDLELFGYEFEQPSDN